MTHTHLSVATVERVAKAICEDKLWHGAFEQETEGNREDWRCMARAAMAAMPSEPQAAPVTAATEALAGAELARWCYENPNLAARTIEWLRPEPQEVVTAEQVMARMTYDNLREPFPEFELIIRLVKLAADQVRRERTSPLSRPQSKGDQ